MNHPKAKTVKELVLLLRPKAVQVKPLDNYLLELQFNNGETRIFDVKPYLTGEWYSKLKQPGIFNTVRIAGLSVEWPDGQDICPDCLYYESKLIKV